jgi:MoaA/NifB/PqqE/SkfB family radical SAM enzyme
MRIYRRVDLGAYCVISVWFGCNNDCTICMLSKVKHKLPAIDYERFEQVITAIVREGRFRNLILSGAEVTTWNELERYVRFAAYLGWFKKIQIQTNGRRLSDASYLEQLIACGVNEFFVSVHGREGVHDDTTRVPGSFRQTMAGLRNLAACDVNVITNTVLTKKNLVDVPNLLTVLAAEKVSELHVWNYFPMERGDSRDLVVRLEDLLRTMPAMLAAAAAARKALVLKSFPLCLPIGPPGFLDSDFPVAVLPEPFWREFGECGFGACHYRLAKQCDAEPCWGLSSAYIEKYGDERRLLRPIASAQHGVRARQGTGGGP